MSFGNHQGGNGFGAFPQQAPPQGAWGFQQQPPPGFAGGYRTPAGPGPAIAEETWFEVEVPFAGAPLPNRCACCCGPVETRRAVTATVTIGRTHYTRRMDIPYCRACEAAVAGGGRRGRLQGLMGLGMAGVFPLLLSLGWLYAPAAVTFVATPVVTLAVLFALAKIWPEEPIARHRGAAVTVAPNGHEDLYLPAGRAIIDVMFNRRAVDRIAADVEHFGKHLASPFGRACYATVSTAYGSAVLTGPRTQMAPAGQRWHTLTRVQDVLEPFPRSVSVGRGQSGAVRRRFTRVHCLTGASLL